MPILNYGMKSRWTLVSSLSKGDIFIFRQYIYDAKKKFKYSNDREFLKTLQPNMKFSKPYIYSFDSTINKQIDEKYIIKLQALLEEANKLMNKEYKNYKLDIMGTWSTGHIVVMKSPNSKNDDFSELGRKAIIKRYQNAKVLPDSSYINNFGKKK